MKHFTLGASALLISFNFFAQPVIQAGGLNPTVGESFTTYSSAYVSPGAGGSNVTWDLSGLTNTGTLTNTFSAANASFPGSNLTSTQTNGTQTQMIYYNMASDGQYWHGINAGGVVIDYQDPMKFLSFPMAMNATDEDYFYATFTSGVDFFRYGTTASEVDGYGTLITPEGTFTDVLRVHYTQDYKDSSDFGEIEYLVNVYGWYKSGTHNELASVSSLVASQGGTQQYASYLETAGLGISEEEMNALSIYPNPAATSTSVGVTAGLPVETLVVLDMQGKTHTVGYERVNDELVLDVASLSGGLYIVKVHYASGLVQQGRLSVN